MLVTYLRLFYLIFHCVTSITISKYCITTVLLLLCIYIIILYAIWYNIVFPLVSIKYSILWYNIYFIELCILYCVVYCIYIYCTIYISYYVALCLLYLYYIPILHLWFTHHDWLILIAALSVVTDLAGFWIYRSSSGHFLFKTDFPDIFGKRHHCIKPYLMRTVILFIILYYYTVLALLLARLSQSNEILQRFSH